VLEAQLADAQREWERWKDGPDATEIATVQARLTAAQAALNSVRIQAPFDGTITSVYTHPGDQVGNSDLGFRLDDLSRILVDAALPEIDINKIKIGQEVILTLDAIPGQEYHSRIVEVPPVAEVVQGVANFNIVVEVTDADENIRPEMTASANVVIDDLQDALLVPNQALRLQNGERVVYIVRGGDIIPVPLKLGSGSTTYSEVLSGDLKEGDQIVLNPPNSIQNGEDRSP
jgi:HlyD family secretion protein